MFGFRKPRWAIELQNVKHGETYILESESIGKLLGYIVTDLEAGRRPSADWNVVLRHKSKKCLLINTDWPPEEKPIEKVFDSSRAIDPKLVRANTEPRFFRIVQGKKIEMSLESEIDGVTVRNISFEERLRLSEEGRESSKSVHTVMNEIFTHELEA